MGVLANLPSPLKGTFLIEASAGTGKTETVSDIFLRLILVEKYSIGQILVVTFTEAATEELKGRIMKRLRDAMESLEKSPVSDDRLAHLMKKVEDQKGVKTRLNEALKCFDEAAIFTIHGFCHKVLQENAFESGSLFNLELVSDQLAIIQEIVDDFWRLQTARQPEIFVRYLMSGALFKSGKRRGPDALAYFALQVLRQPELEVLVPDDPGEISDAERKAFAQLNLLSEIWDSEKENIKSLLLEEPGLNRRSYSVARIPGWIADTEHFLALSDPLQGWSSLEKFCAENLTKACKKGFEPLSHPFFDLCSEFSETLKVINQKLDLKGLVFKKELVDYLRTELGSRKDRLHIRSFDDLLTNLRDSLEDGRGFFAETIRKKFPVALVDEFQDTDQVQYRIFKNIYSTPDSLLFLIGDPKQAIYSFRGADIFTYMAAGQSAKKIPLEKNWRSAPKLVEAVNCLFGSQKNPFVFDDIRFFPSPAARSELDHALRENGAPLSAPLQIWFLERPEGARIIDRKIADRLIPEAVAEEILKLLEKARAGKILLDDKPLDAGDIAVIVRKNRETVLIRDALREKGVPAVIHSHESLFASAEALAVLNLLKGISEPGNNSLVRNALASHLFDIPWPELYSLFQDEPQWEEWIEKFHAWHRLWNEKGFIAMAGNLMAREKFRERILERTDGERQLTNLIHCFEILHWTAVQKHLGMKSLLKWFGRQIEELPEKEEYQLRLETDRKAVNVITIHRSKGLGFPVVFCPYSWFGIRSDNQKVFFHDPEQNNRFCFDMGSSLLDKHRKIMEMEIHGENMRLLYVALTRAKHRCYLVWGAFKGAETSAPSYLFHSRLPVRNKSLDGVFPSFSEMSDEELLADVEKKAKLSEGSIQVAPLPEQRAGKFVSTVDKPGSFEAAYFNACVNADWGIGSFSSMVSGKTEWGDRTDDLEDYGGYDGDPVLESESDELESKNIYAFPRGTKAGLCLHSILEKIDFRLSGKDFQKDLIREELCHFRFDDSFWLETVQETLDKVFSVPLDAFGKTFCLADVEQEKCLTEMEFFFPANNISASGLAKLFAAETSPDVGPSFSKRLRLLSFQRLNGFLKGFIDLVFEHEGKFFIVDWKSNYLGNRLDDYHRERLQEVMEREYYHLQYHLYCLALDKYLRTKIDDYDYVTQFGGIIYVFLRGGGSGYGS